jgi:hypothetical protein
MLPCLNSSRKQFSPGRATFTETDFDRRVLSFPGRAVVVFGAPAEPRTTGGPFLLCAGRVVKSFRLAARFGVLERPTIIVFQAGRKVGRLVGPQSDAVLLGILRGG